MAAVLLAAPARAQIDDAKRLLFEGGYEDGVGNPGPSSPYAYLYLNRPGAVGPGSAWRLALAPVYADTELGIPHVFGTRTDIGLGFSGGGYAFGNSQVIRGDEKPGESFIGHGGGPSISLYRDLADLGPVPLNGVARLSVVYTDFQRTERTDAGYEPPPDEWTAAARAGLRLGGVEPGLDHGQALEVSGWGETRLRDKAASYGYNGDRFVRRTANLYWARVLVSLPAPGGTRAGGGIDAGSGAGVGRLAAYRLGGMLTQNSEFPLILPGYFGSEISARRFVHAWAHTALPLDRAKRWFLELTAAGANVTPIRGTDPGGTLHAGFATGVGYAPADGPMHAEFTYGFSPTALRGSRRGGHSAAVTVEFDFLPSAAPSATPKTRQQGLRWLFGP